MMREVFEAFLTDPIHINEDIYALWLEGHNVNDALLIRLRTPVDLPVLGDEQKLQELLWRDTVDQYRLYEKLEHYLMQPSLFRSQLLFQIPPLQQHYMIERYYSLDGQVGRWLVGKKLTAKLQKDLDEISDQAQRTLKSCRRQLENLSRVYSAMEDRSFHGVSCKAISELYLISEKLASKYACVMFLQHTRLEIHPTHRITGFLTWHDLLFFAAVLMVHWIPQRTQLPLLVRGRSAPSMDASSAGAGANAITTTLSASTSPKASPLFSHQGHTGMALYVTKPPVVENGAEIGLRVGDDWPSIAFLQERLHPLCVRATNGLDLGARLTNSLRDLKAHLINDVETLAVYRKTVMAHMSAVYNAEDLHDLSVKLYLIVHGFLTIGAGLSQPKELKDLLENLITMIVRVLKDCGIQVFQLNDLFSALIDSLAELNVWYLHALETRASLLASWERFLSVCRIVILTMYARIE